MSHHEPHSSIYDILSLMNCTLVIVDLSHLSLITISISVVKCIVICWLTTSLIVWPLVLPLDLTYTPLIHFLLFSVNLLYGYSFHVSSLILIFYCFSHSKESAQFQGSYVTFYSKFFSFLVKSCWPHAQSLMLEDCPLSAVHDCLLVWPQLPSISGGHFPYLWPQDTPWSSDRDPHSMGDKWQWIKFMLCMWYLLQ